MKPLRTLIVDDEHLARRGLSMRLADFATVEVVGECGNGEDALAAIARQQPDLVFLDIQMPGLSGFDVIARVQSDVMPLVVFVTAFNEFAVEAFKVNAIDYVLKPVDSERLEQAVNRAVAATQQRTAESEKQRLMDALKTLHNVDVTEVLSDARTGEESRSGEQFPQKLVIRDGGETRFVPIREVQWIDAAGDYMCVHAGPDTHIMRSTMKHLETLLDPDTFLRVHRSTIVNRHCIKSARTDGSGEYHLCLDGGTELKVSRGYRDVVRALVAEGA